MDYVTSAAEVQSIASLFMRLEDEQGLLSLGDLFRRIEGAINSEGLSADFQVLLQEGFADISAKDYVHLADLLQYRIAPLIQGMAEEAR